MVAGFETDFSRILITMIHERAFKATTTLPFTCLIFQLCRDAFVPVWNYDQLLQATKTLDIGLIWDEVNLAAPRREPHVEVPPLGDDLVADVEQVQGDDTALPATTADAQVPPSPAASLLETEPESAPAASVDEVVMIALFSDDMPPPDSSQAAGKRPRSGRTSDDAEAHILNKKERQQLEETTRASLLKEEIRQQRAREIGVGPSNGVSTTEGAVRVDVSTIESVGLVVRSATDGIPSVDPAGSGKPNPPSS
uniref:Integrase core domain containing protein n=1 Tax=Solanum tuberosum TaxID=4113 RepID=M1DPY4_SOLTU